MVVNNNSLIVQQDLVLCICTYKRSQLLNLLLSDMKAQSLQPGIIIIVDGDPSSGDVQAILKDMSFLNNVTVLYIASNHGNQTYQRYLGWRVSKTAGAKKILYLDDDLRIEQPDAIRNMISPLDWTNRVIVAVTGTLNMGSPKPDGSNITLSDLKSGLSTTSNIISRFGTSRKYIPGDVTPAGNRIPIEFCGNPYESVKWLRGGAIAFRVESLSSDVLSDDIFAMNHLKFGLCEDLIISRRLINSGELLVAFNSIFIHPNENPPVAYSSKSYTLGFAVAYSRKWFNDNYRVGNRPTLMDRLILIKYYLATFFLNIWRAVISANRQRFLFGSGILSGAFYALIKNPSAKSLTPNINWWKDAEEALTHTVVIQ
jgi:glycosyltransferase involved in cell wall biosynthesis